MERKHILLSDDREIVLPVTPSGYKIKKGNNVETINIHELGDATIVGNTARYPITIPCLLPANPYPFSSDSNQEYYMANIDRMIETKQVIRFIVAGTHINIQCVVESVEYGENDGTNDINCEITLKEHPTLEVVKTENTGVGTQYGKPRTPPVSNNKEKNVVAEKGDTVKQICKDNYDKSDKETINKVLKENNIGKIVADGIEIGAKQSAVNKALNDGILKAGQGLKLPPLGKSRW